MGMKLPTRDLLFNLMLTQQPQPAMTTHLSLSHANAQVLGLRRLTSMQSCMNVADRADTLSTRPALRLKQCMGKALVKLMSCCASSRPNAVADKAPSALV